MSKKQKQATLQDVAKHAGVSTATVSRCLNQPDQVVAQTREMVEAAVAELGYVPNFSARALAANRSFTIGAVIPTMENAIFARALQDFQTALNLQDYELLVACSFFKKDVEEQQIRALVSRGVDGILLIGRERSPTIYQFLKARNVAYVIAWSFPKAADQKSYEQGCFVGFDNEAAMYQMTQKVIDYGHRHIAMISGLAPNNDRVKARQTGFLNAMKDQKIAVDDQSIIQSEYDISAARKAFEILLDQDQRLTAIVCANDVLAVGAVLQAQDRGLAVPKDISITGFDDIELANVVTPHLTTMNVPHAQMGERSAQALLGRILADEPMENQQLETFIVERQSLAAPRSKRSI